MHSGPVVYLELVEHITSYGCKRSWEQQIRDQSPTKTPFKAVRIGFADKYSYLPFKEIIWKIVKKNKNIIFGVLFGFS